MSYVILFIEIFNLLFKYLISMDKYLAPSVLTNAEFSVLLFSTFCRNVIVYKYVISNIYVAYKYVIFEYLT